jgi:hypothetical protein
MKTEAQSLLWRVFAVVFVISAGIPQAIGVVSHFSILKVLGSTVIFLACAGVAIWAFGYRLGANIFWKVVALLLVAVLAYSVYQKVVDFGIGKSSHWSGSWIAALATVVALFTFASIALFRAGIRPEHSAERIFEDKPVPGTRGRLDRLKSRATS